MRGGDNNRDSARSAAKFGALALIASAVLLTAIAGLAVPVFGVQPPRPNNRNPALPPDGKARSGLAPGGAIPKPMRGQLGQDPMVKAQTQWPGKVKFKIAAYDSAPLAATYYPARKNSNAPVVVLIHELGQSSRDFESGIEEWKGRSLAEILQKEGYAVVLFDLRGQGNSKGAALKTSDLFQANPALKAAANASAKTIARPPRKNVKKSDAKDKDKDGGRKNENAIRALSPNLLAKVADLQAIYAFLLDRHNRGEFNISKFGILAAGDGANLAAGWAAIPAAAVAAPRPVGDLASLIMISPEADLENVEVQASVRALSKRLPILMAAGEDDAVSFKAVRDSQELIERGNAKSRIETFPRSALRGSKLIRFEPGVTKRILDFLERTLKLKTDEWEPRYNLAPVSVTRGEYVAIPKAEDAANPPAAAPAQAPAPPPPPAATAKTDN